MDVNDNAYLLDKRGALGFIASKLGSYKGKSLPCPHFRALRTAHAWR
jgi:hypothetical protein